MAKKGHAPEQIIKIMCMSTKSASESQSETKGKPMTMAYRDKSGLLRLSDLQTLRLLAPYPQTWGCTK